MLKTKWIEWIQQKNNFRLMLPVIFTGSFTSIIDKQSQALLFSEGHFCAGMRNVVLYCVYTSFYALNLLPPGLPV